MKTLHNPQRHTFASDNYSGVHPEILSALSQANGGHVGAYGDDPYTEQLQAVIRAHFGDNAQAFPVFNGTGANVLALQASLPRWGAVICADSAHINNDESTAPQAVGGFKLSTLPAHHGKLTPKLIAREADGENMVHRAQPLVCSITQSTEFGTIYTPEEIRAISQFCHKRGILLHMDGARLANAAAALDVPLRAITTDVGVDILSFGGTKNGLLLGECIVILQPEKFDNGMKYLRKLNLQLASKMRFLSVQFLALLENDLWKRSAEHANRMAARLAAGLQAMPHTQLIYPTQANAVFVRFPAGVSDKVREHSFFYDWDNDGTVRLMCSFDTQEHDVDALLDAIRTAITTV